MRSLLAFWLGGGGAGSGAGPQPSVGNPIHSIFRRDQPARSADIFRQDPASELWDSARGNFDDRGGSFDGSAASEPWDSTPGNFDDRGGSFDGSPSELWDSARGNFDDRGGTFDGSPSGRTPDIYRTSGHSRPSMYRKNRPRFDDVPGNFDDRTGNFDDLT